MHEGAVYTVCNPKWFFFPMNAPIFLGSPPPSASRVVSCGLLVTSPRGWLLAHATRTPRWDLPKGKLEPGETPLEAALRETHEEIGLDLSCHRGAIVDLGRHAYLPRKDLHLFRLDLPEALDLSACSCSTYVQRGEEGERYPETDDYAWVPPAQVFTRVGKSLMAYFVALDLLETPAKATQPKGRPRRFRG